MGFGLLFFACFLTYFGALTPIGAFTYVLGSAIMLYALYKLSAENIFFAISAVLSALLMLLSMVIVVLDVFGSVGTLYLVLVEIQVYVAPLLLITMLVATYKIAKAVDLRKIQAWSVVNVFFVSIYLVCDMVSLFVYNAEALKRLGLVCLITQVMFSAFMLVILFNCYARICYEDDKDMQGKNSGIPIFNFLNKAFDKVSKKNKGDK